ncbi:hypothetical protein ACED91_11845, partial [Staphylococcus chromogenes]
MLEVTFNVHTGACSPIPEETHELRLTHLQRLTHAEQLRLRRYIIKHRLDVGIHFPLTSTPAQTRKIIRVLAHFVKATRTQAQGGDAGPIGGGILAFVLGVPVFLCLFN